MTKIECQTRHRRENQRSDDATRSWMARECHHSVHDESVASCKKNGDEKHDFTILNLTVGINGDVKIKPQKLVRTLCRFFNQYDTDCQENVTNGRWHGNEEFKGYRGCDSERQHRTNTPSPRTSQRKTVKFAYRIAEHLQECYHCTRIGVSTRTVHVYCAFKLNI